MKDKRRTNKYGNHKTIVDDITFDSKKEADRYEFLKEQQEQGIIQHLECQKEFLLIPPQIYQGKRYRKCSYFADFCYTDSDNNIIVEDVKGFSKGRFSTETPEFRIKRKLLIQQYGKEINFRII